MKKTLYNTVIATFLCLCLTISLCACGAEDGENASIVLYEYAEPINFHTSEQTAYFEDYMSVSAYADGTAELSRPEPVTLQWSGYSAGEYSVKLSESPDMSGASVYTVSEQKIDVYNLKIANKYYWQVECGEVRSEVGSFSTADSGARNLFVDGVTNVRDVGGWITSSGKRMAQGLLFRGARLNVSDPDDNAYQSITKYIREITDIGAQTFTKTLGIKAEVDFRLTTRNGFPSDMSPSSPAGNSVDYIALPLNGSKAFTEPASQENIKAFFEYLAVKDNYPVYFHCNIGTDRTGLIAYLIQGLCGVDEQLMLTDYYFSDFGNIGEFKDPYASTSVNKTAYMDQLAAGGAYEGTTLSERIRSYLYSIGVGEQTVDRVYSIMMGE